MTNSLPGCSAALDGLAAARGRDTRGADLGGVMAPCYTGWRLSRRVVCQCRVSGSGDTIPKKPQLASIYLQARPHARLTSTLLALSVLPRSEEHHAVLRICWPVSSQRIREYNSEKATIGFNLPSSETACPAYVHSSCPLSPS